MSFKLYECVFSLKPNVVPADLHSQVLNVIVRTCMHDQDFVCKKEKVGVFRIALVLV